MRRAGCACHDPVAPLPRRGPHRSCRLSDEVRVILTQRTTSLRVHSGQIAFPGGKIDAPDESPAAAALREAQEEIGLDARHVEPLGYLDPYLTGTGFCIIPVVAKVTAPVSF